MIASIITPKVTFKVIPIRKFQSTSHLVDNPNDSFCFHNNIFITIDSNYQAKNSAEYNYSKKAYSYSKDSRKLTKGRYIKDKNKRVSSAVQ